MSGTTIAAAEVLGQQGKALPIVLEGGMSAWQSFGGDVVHGETTKWAMDRQVRLVAGSLALSGILASVAVPKAKWLSGGIGVGLTISALTNTCAATCSRSSLTTQPNLVISMKSSPS